MNYPNMQHPTKKDMEELGAIRNMLDRQATKQPYDYSTPDDVMSGYCIIILCIALFLIFIVVPAIYALR
jgi:hypothetical protein